jgi:YHS domain-containing protein
MNTLKIIKIAAILIFSLAYTTQLRAQELSENPTCEGSCNIDGISCNRSEACQLSCGVGDYDTSDVIGMTDAKIGDLTTCPVTGVVFRVTDNSPQITHNSENYYFCCSSCKSIFTSNPDNFLPAKE